MRQSINPFHVTLEISAVKAGWSKDKRVFICERDLAIGHLCKSSSPMILRVPTNWETLEDFQNGLIMTVLEQITQKPKATLRWDDSGMVACVNFGNTYISTREHSV
jgi:L-fucose isomerase-like protein